MAAERVKIVNPNGRIGYVAATYPPLVRGAMKVAQSEQAKQRRNEEPAAVAAVEPTEQQAPADKPSSKTKEES